MLLIYWVINTNQKLTIKLNKKNNLIVKLNKSKAGLKSAISRKNKKVIEQIALIE